MALNKYNSSSRHVTPVAAYFPVAATDWGVQGPGATGTAFSAVANLTDVGSGGSLATLTDFFQITWVTALGESLPCAEVSLSVTGGPSGSVTVALASVGSGNVTTQTGAQPIIGWNLYTGATGAEKQNITNAGLGITNLATQTVTNGGVTTTMTYIPIATTTVTLKVLGTGNAPPTLNTSGMNTAVLPLVATVTTGDLSIMVPPSFIPQRMTQVKFPDGTLETAGISFVGATCIAPLWPASTAVAVGRYVVVNSTVFQCSIAGTTAAAAAFPAAFGTSAKGGTVTDNTATWINRGKGRIVRMRYNNPTAGTLQPTAMEYDIFQV